MKLINEFEPIRDWAEERGLYEGGDIKTQTIKLGEEYGELCQAVIKQDGQALEDAVGDMVIVLTNLCELYGVSIELCVNNAFLEIRNRKGKMENGSFVKEDG